MKRISLYIFISSILICNFTLAKSHQPYNRNKSSHQKSSHAIANTIQPQLPVLPMPADCTIKKNLPADKRSQLKATSNQIKNLLYYTKSALTHNLAYQISKATNKNELLRSNHLKSLWYPKVIGSAGYNYSTFSHDHVTDSGRGFRTWVAMEEHIFSFSDPSQLSAAQLIHNMALLQFVADRQKTMLKVTNAYFDVIEALDLSYVAQANMKTTLLAEKMATVGYEENMQTSSQLNQAKADRLQAQSLNAKTNNTLEEAKSHLKLLTGVPVNKLAPLKYDAILKSPEPPNLSYWKDAAEKNNIDLILSNYEIELNRYKLKIARYSRYPSFNLEGGYYYSRNRDSVDIALGGAGVIILPRSETPLQAGVVELSATIPLLSEKINYNQSKLTIALSKAQLTHDNVLNKINLATKDDYLELLMHRHQIKSNLFAVKANQTSYTETQNKVKQHRSLFLYLLIWQTRLLNSEQAYTQSRYTYLKDKLKLLKISGKLDLQSIKNINKLLDSTSKASMTRLKPL